MTATEIYRPQLPPEVLLTLSKPIEAIQEEVRQAVLTTETVRLRRKGEAAVRANGGASGYVDGVNAILHDAVGVGLESGCYCEDCSEEEERTCTCDQCDDTACQGDCDACRDHECESCYPNGCDCECTRCHDRGH